MNNPLLIGPDDFKGRIDISKNLDPERKLNQHILHAQDFDLADLFKDNFYNQFIGYFDAAGVIDPLAPVSIKNLFNGGRYNVSTGISAINPGVKIILVYFTGARLVRAIDNHITPNSFAAKLNDFSERISYTAKNSVATEYENLALAYWGKMQSFLNVNRNEYPLYFNNDCGCESSNRGVRPHTRSIGFNH